MLNKQRRLLVLSFTSQLKERALQPRTQVCISHDVNLNVNLTKGDFTSPAQV